MSAERYVVGFNQLIPSLAFSFDSLRPGTHETLASFFFFFEWEGQKICRSNILERRNIYKTLTRRQSGRKKRAEGQKLKPPTEVKHNTEPNRLQLTQKGTN
jgi:hypothetical protein